MPAAAGPQRPPYPDHDGETGYDDLNANLTTSPRRVQTEYTRLSNVAGPPFSRGDDISFQQIRSGLQRFQQRLVQRIRTAVTALNNLNLTIGTLMSETDTFR